MVNFKNNIDIILLSFVLLIPFMFIFMFYGDIVYVYVFIGLCYG